MSFDTRKQIDDGSSVDDITQVTEKNLIMSQVNQYFSDLASGNFEGVVSATAGGSTFYTNSGFLSTPLPNGLAGADSANQQFNASFAAGDLLSASAHYMEVTLLNSSTACVTFMLNGTATAAEGSGSDKKLAAVPIQWRTTQVWTRGTPLIGGPEQWLLAHGHMSESCGPAIFSSVR